MLYYLMLVPAVLSTAVIYFLSPALSYWWLLPVLLGCFVAANLVYVLLMFVCSLFAGPNRMYDRISPFYLALTLALDGWILALCRIKIHVEGLEKIPTDSEFLFVSNHRSNFDPMVQWWVLRRWPLAFVSKPSNMRKFVIGPFVRRCCFLPIDRENARNALTTINAAAGLIRTLCRRGDGVHSGKQALPRLSGLPQGDAGHPPRRQATPSWCPLPPPSCLPCSISPLTPAAPWANTSCSRASTSSSSTMTFPSTRWLTAPCRC